MASDMVMKNLKSSTKKNAQDCSVSRNESNAKSLSRYLSITMSNRNEKSPRRKMTSTIVVQP